MARRGAVLHWIRQSVYPLLLGALLPAETGAQGTPMERENGSVGVSMQFMSPQGEFRQNVGTTDGQHRGGLGFDLIVPLTRPAWSSMRVEYVFGSYARGCDGCRRSFRSISVGPEVAVPRGPMRPYAMGAWGHLHFEGFEDPGGAETDTGVAQWIYGGGIRVPLKGANGWSLDLGIRRHHAGTVSYLTNAGIQKNPDGSVSVDSARTHAPFLMYSLRFQYQFKRRHTGG